jgi:formate dehydrogenase subunit gamma
MAVFNRIVLQAVCCVMLLLGGLAHAQQSANIFDSSKESQVQRQVSQPGNNAPVWREVNSGKAGYTTNTAPEAGVLIQKSGEAWRQLRTGPVISYGGIALIGTILAIALFFALRGQIKLKEKPTGRLIERFTLLERTSHWAMAISFVLLALTGLGMLFGRYVVIPIFGHALFGLFANIAKVVHNFVGPLFAVTLLVAFFVFVRDNIPAARDLNWLLKGGGLFNGAHVPSHRFNAGEKLWFWLGVFALGMIVSVSGFILDFPNFGQTRADMQMTWTWHVIATLIFICASFGHIYIGTLGTEKALDGMVTGYCDEAWAKEHHEDWYQDIKSGKIPAQRSKDLSPSARATSSSVISPT